MPRIVLIVDDSPVSAANLEIALEGVAGVELRTASSGTEALRILEGPEGNSVCAVFTDLNMPRMDGYALIDAIRSRPGLKLLPVFVLSASTEPEAPRRAIAAGANAFFPKPYSPGNVRARLEDILNAC